MVWGVLWGWHGAWGNLKEKISVRGVISHNGGVSSLVFLAPSLRRNLALEVR